MANLKKVTRDVGSLFIYCIEFKGERLKSRGMVLKLDRNKRTAKGSY